MGVIHTIPIKDARRLFLNSQLSFPNNSDSNKNRLLRIVENLGYVQIDTISIVERSHHHILWTRMPEYRRSMTDELLAERRIFEYWSHAASYLPINDYRYSLVRKKNYSNRHKEWKKANKKILRYVRDRIKSEGPLQSRNFDETRRSTIGWRNSKPSKDALEFLFHEGKLMITRRINFQKVYDLTERVLPTGIDTSEPTESQYYEYLIMTSLRSNGFANEGEITYLRKYDRTKFRKVLNQLLENKAIVNLKVRGLNDQEYFSNESRINKIMKSPKQNSVHILSPFDNLIIQRKRVKHLFNFEYLLECYVPETKRKFGYFCLPVLLGDKFLGKIDAKREAKDKTFKVKKIFWEDENVSISDLQVKLSEFAEFTGCNRVVGL